MEKKIKVVSTTGEKLREISSTSDNWKDLRSELTGLGYSLDASKVILGNTKETLQDGKTQNSDVVLPENDFSIFVLPTKTKSGI